MILEEIRIAYERMKNSITRIGELLTFHTLSLLLPFSMYNSLATWAVSPF